MSDAGTIDYVARDGRAYITLNRAAKKNAMSNDMWDALMGAYERAEALIDSVERDLDALDRADLG